MSARPVSPCDGKASVVGGNLAFGATRCLGAQLAISVHNCPVLADTRFPMSIFKRTQRKYVKKALSREELA